ncbi:RHS repeat-associated core domain-containing protein [Bacillus cereus]|nr:RHS repeat-associated core domain-containing protein [Bacillus cereus]MCU5102190.1 RHS repeat-associated core domain-containing protein [Bacillus cereus]MCU5619363.1 RHS repeat-associated core domain-containing protein [Bacillus cereus]
MIIKSEEALYYNPRGDVVAMTNQNKEVVATYEYDAWGNVVKSDTKGIAADNPFGYAGYMYDKEIGMYYLIARYYNPEHGVFLSIDPDPGDADDPVTQNGYTYVDNNPVLKIDPDGKIPIFAVAAAPLLWLGVAAAGAGAAYYGYKAYKSVSRIEANAKQQARNTAFRLAIRTAGWGKNNYNNYKSKKQYYYNPGSRRNK